MLMSGKVLSLSPSSSSPSSNTSIPTSSSKPNSPLNASSPSAGSQNNFTGYSSPSYRDKFSPTSTSSSFFSSSSPGHQSSTLLNSWSSRPLGSHNFRNTTSNVNSRSNSTISGSTSYDTTSTNNKSTVTGPETINCDNISKSSKRKREEWTHVNNNDDQSSHHHYGGSNSVRRVIKINSRQAKRLMREQKNKRCIVKIGQKIETQLPVSELINLRENRCVNLANVIGTVSPLSKKLSVLLSNTSSCETTSSKGNNNNNTNTSHTSIQPTRQIIGSNNIDSKRAFEATKHISVGGGGRCSNPYSDPINHQDNCKSDDHHASSRKAKPSRYIGPKSRRGYYTSESRDNSGGNRNLNKEMTAEDKYDALINRTTTSTAKSKGRDGDPSNGQRSLPSNLANQYSHHKLENGKDASSSKFSGDGNSDRGEKSNLSIGQRPKGIRESDSYSEGCAETKDRGHQKLKGSEGRDSSESSSSMKGLDTYDKLSNKRDKMGHFINPIKLSQLPSWKKTSSNQWNSHSSSERKSLEKSIEKLKFPSSRESSNDCYTSKSNSCSTRPENPPSSSSSSSSSISSSHLASPALAAAAAIAASRETTSLLQSAKSSYTTSFHTSKSAIRSSSTLIESKLSSSISPSSPKSASPTSKDTIMQQTTATDTVKVSSDSSMGDDGQQPSIVAAYSLKSFEDAPEGENLMDDNGWSLQPISPSRNSSIDDPSAKSSLHKRFFPQKYASERTHSESMRSESSNNDKQNIDTSGKAKYHDKVDMASSSEINTKRPERKQEMQDKESRVDMDENNKRNKCDEDNGMPLLWHPNRTNKPSSNDAELLPESRPSTNKKEFTRNNSLTNENVIKDYLLNQEKIHKPEKSDSSYVANSKKFDKFKSYLKRTFQTEDITTNIPSSERPNKLLKLDTSSSALVKSDTDNADNVSRIANEKIDEEENNKSIFSSSNSTPSSPGTSQNSPKSGNNVTLPLKHRHHHPKKAIAAASSSTMLSSKASSSNNSVNNNENNQTKDNNNAPDKEKKVSPENSTPSSPANGTPSKSNTNSKKKQKKADPIVNKLRELGEQKETLTRICHELPGYNWLEEKIRKSKSSTTSPNDPAISQASSSTTSTTATNSENIAEGGDSDNLSLPKASSSPTEKDSNAEKNASIVDEANNTKRNANKIFTCNLSQSNADDKIDTNKKITERENVEDEKEFCRAVAADDSKNEKMAPNKDSSRFINDEIEHIETTPSVDYSSGVTPTGENSKSESSDVIGETTSSNEGRISSPISDSSIPKDLSLGSKTNTRSPCTPPEPECPSPMATSISSNKDSPKKKFSNFNTSTPTGSQSSITPFSAPTTTNTTPQATFKYEYMSNSLSVRLEPSSNTSREEAMTSPVASLNPRTGKFDNYDFFEHKENALEGKLDGLHTSIELQQKRKLLDEIESLKKQKINELEELARIQQYKNLCIQELSSAKEQVLREKEYLKKIQDDGDRFKQHFATQQGEFARMSSFDRILGEEQSRPQSHPTTQTLRDRYKYEARMMQQEQIHRESSSRVGASGNETSKRNSVSYSNSTQDDLVSVDTKDKIGASERLSYAPKSMSQNEGDEVFDGKQKRDTEKERNYIGLEPKSPQSLLKPEWYKAQHSKSNDSDNEPQLQEQKLKNSLDKRSDDFDSTSKRDRMSKQGSSFGSNESQAGEVTEGKRTPQSRRSSDLTLKDIRQMTARTDEEIQLIHEKYNDRITVTRESERSQMERQRSSAEPKVGNEVERKGGDDLKIMQPSQPKNKEDITKSLDLTHSLDEHNKNAQETKPKDAKDTQYRHILPAAAPSQQLEKARTNQQSPFARMQGQSNAYSHPKSQISSYEYSENIRQKVNDEKSREEFKQNFELRHKQLEQDSLFQQKSLQSSFSPSSGQRITTDSNRAGTWSGQQPPVNSSETVEKQPKPYLTDHQQQQLLSRKSISDQSITPQRVPNPSVAGSGEFVNPQSMTANVQQSQHMQSQLRPQQPAALQSQFRGSQSQHPQTSPQLGSTLPSHPQMQGAQQSRQTMAHLYANQHSNQKGFPNQHEQFYAAAMSAATAAAAAASNGMDPKSAAVNAARQLAPPQSSFNSVAFQNMAAAAAAAALATCGGRNTQAPPYPSQMPRQGLPQNDRSAQFNPAGMDMRRGDHVNPTGRDVGNMDERSKGYPMDLGHMTANRNNAMWFAMQQHQKEQLQKLQYAQQPQNMKQSPQLMAHQQSLGGGVPAAGDRQSSSHLNLPDKHSSSMHASSNLTYNQQQQLAAQQRQQQQQHQQQFERQATQSRQLAPQHDPSHPYDRAATLSRQDRNVPYGRHLPPPPSYAGHASFTQEAERSWRSQQSRNTTQAQEISSSGAAGVPMVNSSNTMRMSPKGNGGQRLTPRSGSRGSDLGFSEVVASARNSITRMENSAAAAIVQEQGNSDGNRRPFGPDVVCKICKKEASFMCSACRGAHYCSLECQRVHWMDHSKHCVSK